ncbi:MAG: dihydrodipicolinate synthase family protein [Rhodospirillaceae bacterium]|jgi:4-hydroxy-tetrahydrodipicolinate synthase|nr:dihydrodipicolinate synthase family protein [Rhodospirillaceae bacterium]MBT5943334.1 dihydrodipicolinate synthase family protein [Rhodospirillaceae bacterium]MBT6404777.1 dihydrodipicolinate synthase family protein [Rhodospirillaceae bacterium]MBT6537783.1 dihydrodipicolinate synthase family protein [Rhodospirillaceae bacterium]MBT7362002.1 dihydrodipicolinate synthase family protein [Rhodospirillaceae bacterium]
MMTTQPAGVFAASLTPMTADLEIDVPRAVAHNQWLLANGCNGVAPLGTTGEANSLSLDERLALLDALADAGITGPQLIAGVGCTAIPDTVTLTRKALANGAGGVLMLPPFYYKAPSEDGLFAAFAEVIERVGDPALQIYLYNFPQQVGFELPLSLIARLVEAYPDTVVGSKDSSGDWPRMERTMAELPGFRLFPGSEEFLLAGLRQGAVGCISATVNVTAPQSQDVYANWRADNADDLQNYLTELRMAFKGLPAIPVMKAYHARERNDSGFANLRPPFTPASEADLATVSERLAAASFKLAA